MGKAEGGDRLGFEQPGPVAHGEKEGYWPGGHCGLAVGDTGFNRIPWLLWSQGQVQGDRWEVENSRTRAVVR